MGQESMHDYYLQAREIAKVEKTLKVEHWDCITIEFKTSYGKVILKRYDLPRDMVERWEWAIRWRVAKFQCKYPKKMVQCYHSPYRRVMGAKVEIQHDLDRFIAAKAQVSLAQRLMDEYVERQKASNMFFDEEHDEDLRKFREKLESKRKKVEAAEERLIDKVRLWNEIHNKDKKR